MKIRSLYQPDVFRARARESLPVAARRMMEHGVSCLAVLQSGQLVGILTERDLVRAMGDGVAAQRAHVGDYMTPYPFTAHPDEDSAAVARLMLDLGVRHLPVVEDGRVVGIISTRELLVLEAWPTARAAS